MLENARGVLFKNVRKKSDKAPDYTGNIDLTPELLEAYLSKGGTQKAQLAAWIKTGAKGTFLSVSLEKPYEGGRSAPPPAADDGSDPF